MLVAAPWVSLARYLWHAWYILEGRGAAARFRAEGNAGPKMLWYLARRMPPFWGHCRGYGASGGGSAPRAHHARGLSPSAARRTPLARGGWRRFDAASAHPWHEGGGAGSLLVIVPAFNEEGAIGGRGRRSPPQHTRRPGAGDRRLLARRHDRGARDRPGAECFRCRIILAWAARAGGIQAGVRTRISSTSSAWMAMGSTTPRTSRAFWRR